MKHTLWYNTWTELYREGLPIGNGRLAAMMLGRPEKLRVALNHEWMWRGENRFREYPDVSEHLPEIREALLQGDFEKGTALANEHMGGLGGVSGVRNRVDPYQPVGDLWVEVHVLAPFAEPRGRGRRSPSVASTGIGATVARTARVGLTVVLVVVLFLGSFLLWQRLVAG